ncbi:alpha/beta fold hydrolase [Actinorhabdospora filicis]|nr:alpha/beta fold hydrolase [Actinorhabdospora filicis]
MMRRSILAAATGVLVAAALIQPAAAADPSTDGYSIDGNSGTDGTGGVAWAPCPQYSDEVLAHLGLREEDYPKFRQLWARTECGTVQVPLDYKNPRGQKITVAITRLKARDRKHRQGVLSMNPGGPGGSGYMMPQEMYLRGGEDGLAARLNERYDLIGFDPRGVGYSTSYDCPDNGPGGPGGGPITEAVARQAYEELKAANKACSESNPSFLRQLTTTNVARDLDRVRAALGERKMNFFGVSWGTWLGVQYRNEFPERVANMWVDSTAIPEMRLDVFGATRSKATYDDFTRMAQWLAERDAEYGFGDTRDEVIAAIAALKADYDAHPRNFVEIPEPLDGFVIGISGTQPAPVWPVASRVLRDLRDVTGEHAPPSLLEVWGGGGGPQGPPPAGMPRMNNRTMNQAVMCNEDMGSRDFETSWAAYQKRLVDEPVTGFLSMPIPGCAGWTLDPQPVRLRHSNASLVMSGHRYEAVSPYQWTPAMRAEVGGSIVSVNDDVHGSAAMTADCSALIASYFERGRLSGRTCEGEGPLPREDSVESFSVGQSFSEGQSFVEGRSFSLR